MTSNPDEDRPQGETTESEPSEAAATSEGPPARTRWSVVALSVVDYLFYILYALLGLRFLLAAMGAREEASFVQLVHGVTDPFYAPFENVVGQPAVDGAYLDFPVLVALIGYLVLHLVIRGLLRIIGQQTG